jgi:hypothetical protein
VLVSGLFGAVALAPDNSAHGVEVLNLWATGEPHDPAHAYADMLISTAVPEASIIGLAVVGLLGVLGIQMSLAKLRGSFFLGTRRPCVLVFTSWLRRREPAVPRHIRANLRQSVPICDIFL